MSEQVTRRYESQSPRTPAGDSRIQSSFPGRTLQTLRTNRGSADHVAPNVAPPSVYRALRSPGKPLDSHSRRLMESHFRHDFGSVRVHEDGGATQATRAIQARAFTVAEHIVFNSGQLAPATTAGKTLLAHELTHVIQQRGRTGVSRATVQRSPSPLDSSAKPGEREDLRILRTETVGSLSPDDVKKAMTNKSTGRVPANAVTFSPEIDSKIQNGLQNIAAEIFNPNSFTFNTLTNLPPNLKQYGGVNGVYRFTIVQRKTNPKVELLIEQVADVPPFNYSSVDLAAQTKRFDSFGLALGSGFEADDRKKMLFGAQARVPESILTRVKGLTFIFSLADSGDVDEPAVYDPNTHTITLFKRTLDNFSNSTDASGSDWFTLALTHEVGHALDHETFTNARLKRDALTKQLADLRSKSRQINVDPNAPISKENNVPDEMAKARPEIQRIQKELNKADSDFTKASNALNTDTGGRHSSSKEFSKAKRNPISGRGAKDSGEDFAELLSVFVLDPTLLKSLRPDAYQYFTRKFK